MAEKSLKDLQILIDSLTKSIENLENASKKQGNEEQIVSSVTIDNVKKFLSYSQQITNEFKVLGSVGNDLAKKVIPDLIRELNKAAKQADAVVLGIGKGGKSYEPTFIESRLKQIQEQQKELRSGLPVNKSITSLTAQAKKLGLDVTNTEIQNRINEIATGIESAVTSGTPIKQIQWVGGKRIRVLSILKERFAENISELSKNLGIDTEVLLKELSSARSFEAIRTVQTKASGTYIPPKPPSIPVEPPKIESSDIGLGIDVPETKSIPKADLDTLRLRYEKEGQAALRRALAGSKVKPGEKLDLMAEGKRLSAEAADPKDVIGVWDKLVARAKELDILNRKKIQDEKDSNTALKEAIALGKKQVDIALTESGISQKRQKEIRAGISIKGLKDPAEISAIFGKTVEAIKRESKEIADISNRRKKLKEILDREIENAEISSKEKKRLRKYVGTSIKDVTSIESAETLQSITRGMIGSRIDEADDSKKVTTASLAGMQKLKDTLSGSKLSISAKRALYDEAKKLSEGLAPDEISSAYDSIIAKAKELTEEAKKKADIEKKAKAESKKVDSDAKKATREDISIAKREGKRNLQAALSGSYIKPEERSALLAEAETRTRGKSAREVSAVYSEILIKAKALAKLAEEKAKSDTKSEKAIAEATKKGKILLALELERNKLRGADAAALRLEAATASEGKSAREIEAIYTRIAAKVKAIADTKKSDEKKPKWLSSEEITAIKETERFSRAFANIEQFREKRGLTEEPKISITEYGDTGVATVTAEMRSASGQVYKFNQAVNGMGNAIQQLPKRMQPFVESLRANIRDFVQWSMIAGTFYTVLSKISELWGIAVKNEEELANITVSLGKAQADTNQIFEDAYKVAQTTGESLNGVLEGYALAYRVTSEYADINERAAITNKVMVDSLTLSKLSTMDQAEALDVLVASLEQAGMELTDGSKLLDFWVTVSKQTNADLTTLAQTYAIVGETANNAGLDINKTAALTAALAKSSTATGKELGNSVRFVISALQSPAAAEVLNKYGIAIEDIDKNLRPIGSIIEEINAKAKAGIISTTALSEITSKIGQGSKGQTKVSSALLGYEEELGKINNLTDYTGASQEALNIKLETVGTAINSLSNSFQKLAQTVGNEGGVLDVSTVFLKVLTGIIEALDGLITVIPSVLPSLLSLGAVIYGGATPGGLLGTIPDKIAKGLGGRMQYGAASTVLGTALTVGSNIAQGDTEGAIYSGIGGIIGGAIGTAAIGVLGPYAPILGAQIGAAAGDALAGYADIYGKKVRQSVGDVGGLIPITEENKQKGKTDRDAAISRLEEIAGATNMFGAMKMDFYQFEANLGGNIQAMMTGQRWQESDALGTLIAEAIAIAGNDPEKQKETSDLINTIVGTSSKMKEEERAIQESGYLRDVVPLLTPVLRRASERLQSQIDLGQVTVAEARRRREGIEGVQAFLPDFQKYIAPTALEGTGQQGIIDFAASFMEFSSQDSKAAMNTYIATIKEADAKIAENTKLLEEVNLSEARKTELSLEVIVAEENKKRAIDYATNAVENFGKELINLTAQFPTQEFKDITASDFNKLYAESMRILEERLTSQANLDPNDLRDASWVQDILKNVSPVTIVTSDTTKTDYYNTEALAILSSLDDETKKQTGILNKSLGLSFYELPGSVVKTAMDASTRLGDLIKSRNAKFDNTQEEMLAVTKDGFVTGNAHQQIMNFLLGKIEENTAKQLEGLYNMPEGANFYFPSSVLPYVGAANGSGGMDLSGMYEIIAMLEAWASSLPLVGGEQTTITLPDDVKIEGINTAIRTEATKDIPADVWQQIGQQMLGWTTGASDKISRTMEQSKLQMQTKRPTFENPYGIYPPNTFPPLDPTKLSPIQQVNRFSDEIAKISNNLQVKINSTATINLTLDGRQIATALRPYFADLLAQFEGTNSSISRNVSVTI